MPGTSIRRIVPAAILLWYATSLLWGLSLDHDEVEHLHCAWLVAGGRVPYVDFWQNHSPLLWLLLAPLLRVLPPGGLVAPAIRVLTVLLLAASIYAVVRIGRRVHAERRYDLLTVLLCLGFAGSSQLGAIRPDLVANVLSLGAICLILASPKLRSVALAAFLAGLAFSFDPKHAWILGVAPVAALVERVPPARLAKVLAAHAVGVLAGLVPLAAYLAGAGLAGTFVDSVFRANSRYLGGAWFTGVHLTYPGVALCVVALWAQLRGPAPATDDGRRARRTVMVGVVLSLVEYVGKPGDLLQYPFQMTALLSAPLAAPVVSALLARARARSRLAPIAIGLAFYGVDAIIAYNQGDHSPHFGTRSTIGELVRLAGDGPVVTRSPFHPIFSDDSLVIYNAWQWRWRHGPGIVESLRHAADRIAQSRPTLVLAAWGEPGLAPTEGKTFLQLLVDEKILPPEDGARLTQLFRDDYRLVQVAGLPFWVRKDRLADSAP